MSSQNLYNARAHLRQEIENNPALKLRLAAIIDLENPGAGTAVAESLFNRSLYSDRSVAQGLGGGENSFYGPVRRGLVDGRMRELAKDPDRLAQRYAQIHEAYSSNHTQGHTDQGSSGDPNYEKGGTGVNINGERFNDWGGGPGGHEGARTFRADLVKLANDDTGGNMLASQYLNRNKSPFPTIDPNNPLPSIPAVGGPSTTAVPYINPAVAPGPQGVTLDSNPITPNWSGTTGTAGGTNMVTPQGAAPIVPGPVAPDAAPAAPQGVMASLSSALQDKDGKQSDMSSGLDTIAKGFAPKAAPVAIPNLLAGAPEANSANGMAAQLMAALIQSKNRGLTLTGR